MRIVKQTIGIAFGAILALSAPPIFGETQSAPVLNVTGEGVVSVPVKFARITVSVTSTKKTAASAQADAGDRADRLVRMLKAEQVSQLNTERISLRTIVDNKKTGRTIQYFASNTLSYRVAIERAGKLLDKSVTSGADKIDSVQLIPEDSAVAAARKKAMAAAALDAREKADVVLLALGLRAKQIRQIDVDLQFGSPMPITRQSISKMRTPVVGGQTEIRVIVRMSVGY